MADPVQTVHIPTIIVLHHIIVMSSLRLPHEAHGWSEAEYALWTQKHDDEKEQWALIESVVNDQVGEEDKAKAGEEKSQADGKGEDKEEFYVDLIREVLHHARYDEHEADERKL